ncbi:DoxX family protein [Halorarius litoreus]|uniref:DoxX family protein n=1 Tax=Halorarius litoreus TaxID=2962676 RepID=UPI0020CD0F77|nr:DoxX family membrane protein [Halorarius litoreus]
MTDEARPTFARYRRPLRYVMGGLYVLAGVLHFVAPKVYAQIVPPQLPRPLDLVYLSGVAEIVLGVGVLFDRTRRLSAWGIVALLVAVFPANVYMATSDVTLTGVPDWASDPPAAARWARLPLQAVLALWAWWYTQPLADETA